MTQTPASVVYLLGDNTMDELLTPVYVALYMDFDHQMKSSNCFEDEAQAEDWGHHKGKRFLTVVPLQMPVSMVVYEG